MNTKKVILPVFAALLALTVVAGSEGITLIVHTCKACHSASVKNIASQEMPVCHENCCGHCDECCNNSNGLPALHPDCCDYSIEHLALSSFVKTDYKNLSSFYFDITGIQTIIMPQDPNPVYRESFTNNKNSGRLIIQSNCQLLS